MENLQSQIEERINGMVSEVLVLVRRAAIDAMNSALSGTEAVGAPRAKARASSRGKRSSGSQNRRTPEELARLCDRLYAEVEKAPGEGMALYSKELGLSVRELSLPTQQLRKAGRVRTVGERDRMLYFPMGEA